MILDDICNSRVYDANAFYVLGLPVDSTSRKIRRRQEDVIEGCAAMGDKAWRNEFDKYLLGDSVPPKSDAARKLFERLQDPEYYAFGRNKTILILQLMPLPRETERKPFAHGVLT